MDRGAPSDPADPGPTVDVLADLQAGLLDDATATRIRRRVREDPVVAARLAGLDRVRRELRELGQDSDSAPPVSQAVTGRIQEALRTAPRSRLRLVAALIGACAAVAAVGVGTATLLRAEEPPVAGPQAAPPTRFPLTEAQLLEVMGRPPDFGPLIDPRRRRSCLAGLDYPASTIPLGATVVAPRGEPVTILLLPEDASRAVRAVAVRSSCSAADTGLLAETTFDLP